MSKQKEEYVFSRKDAEKYAEYQMVAAILTLEIDIAHKTIENDNQAGAELAVKYIERLKQVKDRLIHDEDYRKQRFYGTKQVFGFDVTNEN